MKKFNLNELVSQLQEDYREFDIGDNVAVHFKGVFQPIKINDIVIDELKIFKGSFCIYSVYNEDYNPNDYKLDIEMLSIEEYSNSPYSIYINNRGELNTYEYHDITTIELGNILIFRVQNNKITHYKFTFLPIGA
jgi:hypothetical protein